jgi:hypothetical protein
MQERNMVEIVANRMTTNDMKLTCVALRGTGRARTSGAMLFERVI